MCLLSRPGPREPPKSARDGGPGPPGYRRNVLGNHWISKPGRGTGSATCGCPSQSAYSQYKMPPKVSPRIPAAPPQADETFVGQGFRGTRLATLGLRRGADLGNRAGVKTNIRPPNCPGRRPGKFGTGFCSAHVGFTTKTESQKSQICCTKILSAGHMRNTRDPFVAGSCLYSTP